MALPVRPVRGKNTNNTPATTEATPVPSPAPEEDFDDTSILGFESDSLTDFSPEVEDFERLAESPLTAYTPGNTEDEDFATGTIQLVSGNESHPEDDADITGMEHAYKQRGQITAEQAINEPYAKWKHLDERIEKMTQEIQETLKEQGQQRLEEVAEARRTRGKKFEDIAMEIDRLILRRVNSGDVVAPEDVKHFIAAVSNEILGFGPIEPLWGDPAISEIMVNGPNEIYVERKGRTTRAYGVRFRDAGHLLFVAQQMLNTIGRRIDVQNPTEDGSLPDGSRINVVHQVIAPEGPTLTIRRFPDTIFSLKKLVELKSMTEEMAEEIGNLVHHKLSMIIVGGTGTGKTSMLNAISGCIPDGDRIITIEDTKELQLNKNKHVVSLVSRPASSKGTGAVTIRQLVKTTLRMRPDRVVVGEVRDSSAYDMLQAMNTGHEGSLTTVHANDAVGAVERISLLVSEAGDVSPDRAMSLIAGGVDVFIIIKRYEDGSRRVQGIYEVPSHLTLRDGKLYLDPIQLWEFEQAPTGEDDAVHGEYVKKNPISESLIRKHSLDKKKRLSLEELYQISAVELRR